MQHFIGFSNIYVIGSKFFSVICSISMLFFSLFYFAFGSGAKELAESFVTSLLENPKDYFCDGNRSKATCNAKIIKLDKNIKLRNVILDVVVNNKNSSWSFKGDIDISDAGLEPIKKVFLPNKFDCNHKYNLKNIILSSDDKCNISSSTYDLTLHSLADTQSDVFRSKNIDDAIQDSVAMFEGIDQNQDLEAVLSKFKFNHKQLVINLKGSQLGDSVFKAMKANDSSLTKEVYDSTIALGVAMIPSYLSQLPNITPATSSSLSKVAGSIADIITSRKESAKITLKRKSNTPVSLSLLIDFIDNLDSDRGDAFLFINDYDITSISE
ncbi:hypothetical protein LS73_006800 [Helicobacter muridarum]|uniref:Uncharacterized protein n=1 Tax=Helicobacter muridarum TaxID=216 RepID=A0A099TWQ3_9HELI|nr:hypothetical protein [Helicobacter muridarum]TLD99773.1 hypothetical protein LS73_006800 [Helicobacter muridarum]STQ86993.1 Uncharacterised protein [Helicobacter muridarum]